MNAVLSKHHSLFTENIVLVKVSHLGCPKDTWVRTCKLVLEDIRMTNWLGVSGQTE